MKLFLFKNDLNRHLIGKLIIHLGMDFSITNKLIPDKSAYILSGNIYDQFHHEFDPNLHVILVIDVQSSIYLEKRHGIRKYDISKINICKNENGFAGYLSGLTLEVKRKIPVFISPDNYEILFKADDYPIVIQKGQIIFSCASSIVDIDNEVFDLYDPVEYNFAEIIPIVLFIKYYFGTRTWTLTEKVACLIIDDPVLKKVYGYISFKEFVEWLCNNRFAATFAFIPWNYRRSNLKIIDLFINHANSLSICIHGCDHTKKEYSNENPYRLGQLSEIALNRMDYHEEITGLPYDKVMVFPQGKFSSEAIDTLQLSGYTAVVNSTVFPTNYKGGYTIKDFISPTIKTNSGLHIFRRRYPNKLIGFALDLLLERPLIVVQHHQDFKNGYGALTLFFNQILELDSKISWKPIGKLIDECRWQRNHNLEEEIREIDKFTGTSERNTLINSTSRFYNLKVILRRWLSEIRDYYIH